MYEVETVETATEVPVAKKALTKAFRAIYDVIETLVIAGAIVVFVYLFIASPHEVLGRSMEDSFYNGEYLLADKVSYLFREPERGEVVIFKQTDTSDYIKRVIGTPGDTVEVRDGFFYVNGERLPESEYISNSAYTDPGIFLKEGRVYIVPEGKFFVAGDNREHSSDSRTFGPVEEDKIKGRALVIYWPLSHLKVVDRPSYNQE
jgi:signal peptidase I